ncbi:MAG: PAS domain-containing protein [Candidatus Cloacimonetes bacterium]|nr:PAS domain-containing protein [Candidatus Cloacimonadota bacterium]
MKTKIFKVLNLLMNQLKMDNSHENCLSFLFQLLKEFYEFQNEWAVISLEGNEFSYNAAKSGFGLSDNFELSEQGISNAVEKIYNKSKNFTYIEKKNEEYPNLKIYENGKNKVLCLLIKMDHELKGVIVFEMLKCQKDDFLTLNDFSELLSDFLTVQNALQKSNEYKSSLEKTLERMNFALDGSRLGLWDWDINEEKIFYETNWLKMLGYPHEKMSSAIDFFISFVHNEDREFVTERLIEHLRGNIPYYQATYRVKTADDDIKWIHAMGKIISKDEVGHPTRMVGTYTDVTMEIETKSNLDAINSKYKSVFAQNSLGIILLDQTGCIEDINQSAVNSLVGLPEKVLGEKFTIIPNIESKIKNHIENIIKSNNPLSLLLNDANFQKNSNVKFRVTISKIQQNDDTKNFFIFLSLEQHQSQQLSNNHSIDSEIKLSPDLKVKISSHLGSIKSGIESILLLRGIDYNLPMKEVYDTLSKISTDAKMIEESLVDKKNDKP